MIFRAEAKIRYIAKEIIVAYVQHVKQKIKERNPLYIESGVDNSYDVYERLFTIVISRYFKGLSKVPDSKGFSDVVILDCMNAIDLALATSKYKNIVSKNSEVISETCLVVYEQVERGLREND